MQVQCANRGLSNNSVEHESGVLSAESWVKKAGRPTQLLHTGLSTQDWLLESQPDRQRLPEELRPLRPLRRHDYLDHPRPGLRDRQGLEDRQYGLAAGVVRVQRPLAA